MLAQYNFYNYVGNEDLHNGGTLDLYFADGFVDLDSSTDFSSGDTILYNSDLPPITVGGNPSPQVVGLSSTSTSNDNVLLASGNMPGRDQEAANFGVGNDNVLIGTNPTMDMNGIYLGGAGFDSLNYTIQANKVLKLTLVQVISATTQLL